MMQISSQTIKYWGYGPQFQFLFALWTLCSWLIDRADRTGATRKNEQGDTLYHPPIGLCLSSFKSGLDLAGRKNTQNLGLNS
jgi:hypothetical protein